MPAKRLGRGRGAGGRNGGGRIELAHQAGDGAQVGIAAFVGTFRGFAAFVPPGAANVAESLENKLALVLRQFESQIVVHDLRRPLPGNSRSLMNRSPSRRIRQTPCYVLAGDFSTKTFKKEPMRMAAC